MIFKPLFKLALGVVGALALDQLLEKRAEEAARRREERRPSALVGRLLDTVNSRLEGEPTRPTPDAE